MEAAISVAAVCRRIAQIQDELLSNHPTALVWRFNAMRINPGQFKLAQRIAVAIALRQAAGEVWVLSQFLPTQAANDPPSLPGAA